MLSGGKKMTSPSTKPLSLLLKQAHRGKKKLQPILEYENFEPIGSGGFGTVYKAYKKNYPNPFAIKVMSVSENIGIEGIKEFFIVFKNDVIK